MTLLNSVIGEEIFLQGKYLSLGINSSGTLGTRAEATKGIVTDAVSGYYRLGMVGDVDGFGVGKAATRDVMLAGTPIEGFSVGYDIGSKHFVKANNERSGIVQIAGGDSTNLSDATAARAGWAGTTTENVKINQTMTLSDDAKFVRVDVTLTNASGSAVDNLRYMRTIDPDHGSSFNTINKVIEQGGDNTGGALIAAYTTNNDNPFFYYTQDERAKVSSFGFLNNDPFAAAAYENSPAKGYVQSVKGSDTAINIDFALGKLAAGATTTITFYMGVTNDLASTVKEIDGSATPATVPTPVNAAPEAVADKLAVKFGETGSGNVLANDKDANGDALSAKLVSGPSHGTLKFTADGSYSYTPDSGYSGQDSFVYSASDGKAATSATVSVTVAPALNNAPVANVDAFSLAYGATTTGNVLANDRDADGDVLKATLKSGPSNGTVTLNADGSFKYAVKAGFSGTDSFVYSATDGKDSASATVTLTVDPAPVVKAPTPVLSSAPVTAAAAVPVVVSEPATSVLSGVLARGLVQDGSSATADKLVGTSGSDTFFFDTLKDTGKDVIEGFGLNDLLVTTTKIYDKNDDGLISFKTKLSLDGPDGKDVVSIVGTGALRFLGSDDAGHFVYGDSGARPKGAIESLIGDDALKGDVGDKKTQTFFFDSKLGLDLGSDTLTNFGVKDRVVTTEALSTDASGKVTLGAGGVLDVAGGQGHVVMTDAKSVALSGLEFDGSVTHDGATYYVYSHVNSTVGTVGLTF